VRRRVLFEHRGFIVVLIVALAVNVGVYAAFVYPLVTRVADADNRAARAERARRDARREFDAAQAVATSKERAEAELRTFYGDVLPAGISAARRLTYLSLAQLARQSNLRVVHRTAAEEHERGSGLDHLRVALVLEGQYEDIRTFVYRLETAPEFVIIDDVALDQGRDAQNTLVLTMQLSTYYRASGNAN
jgi:Tfp pilus assembly protein PilO